MTIPEAPSLPFVPGFLRSVLLADDVFSDLCGARCGTRAPSDVSSPFAIVQGPGGFPIDASAGAWSPLAQVNGWCPNGLGLDPEDIVWRIVTRAAGVLSRVRNASYGGARWTARVIDGPLPTPLDRSRGESQVLYGCLIRAELKVHAGVE